MADDQNSQSSRQPWLRPLPGETKQQYQRRTNHCCWSCGRFEEDLAVLDAHEATHR